jgi:hypothetical protein
MFLQVSGVSENFILEVNVEGKGLVYYAEEPITISDARKKLETIAKRYLPPGEYDYLWMWS